MLRGHAKTGPLDINALDPSEPAARLGVLWRDAGGEPGHAPSQDSFSPVALFPVLPFLAMIEAFSPAKVAWIGNGLKELLGGDPAGLHVEASPLASMLPSEALDGLRQAHPWQVSARLTGASGTLSATATWFPLKDGALGIVSVDT